MILKKLSDYIDYKKIVVYDLISQSFKWNKRKNINGVTQIIVGGELITHTSNDNTQFSFYIKFLIFLNRLIHVCLCIIAYLNMSEIGCIQIIILCSYALPPYIFYKQSIR